MNGKVAASSSQREIAEKTGLSLGTVNKTLAELASLGLVGADLRKETQLTRAGLEALEPYRVKRAVVLAAGFGSRMVPITLTAPKPLVRVHGKRIVETLLDAVSAAGIPEIVLVRGYLGQQFEVLKHRYPHIQFLENPLFNEANNISSCLGRPRPASKRLRMRSGSAAEKSPDASGSTDTCPAIWDAIPITQTTRASRSRATPIPRASCRRYQLLPDAWHIPLERARRRTDGKGSGRGLTGCRGKGKKICTRWRFCVCAKHYRIEVRPCLGKRYRGNRHLQRTEKDRSGLQHLRPLSSGRP